MIDFNLGKHCSVLGKLQFNIQRMIIVTSRLIKIICRDRSRIKYFRIPFNSLLFNIPGGRHTLLEVESESKSFTAQYIHVPYIQPQLRDAAVKQVNRRKFQNSARHPISSLSRFIFDVVNSQNLLLNEFLMLERFFSF